MRAGKESGKWEVGSGKRSRVGILKACLGKRYVAGLPRNASGVSRGSVKCMDGNSGVPVTRGLLACWGASSAVLEAVPSAWTVTQGVVDGLRASTVTSSVPPPFTIILALMGRKCGRRESEVRSGK